MHVRSLSLRLILTLLLCGYYAYASAPPTQAKKYLNELLDLLEANSVKRKEIDWKMFRQDVLRHGKDCRTIPECYPTAQYAVAKLEDHHSYFSSAVGTREIEAEQPLPVYTDEVTPSSVGYIRVNYCVGDETKIKSYIEDIHGKIIKQCHPMPIAWIVDLRDNFGGNMWPMIAGLGLLLENGVQGYFIDPDGNNTSWSFEKGTVFLGKIRMAENEQLRSSVTKQKIAVLINNRTASSGEAIAVLFKGYPNTRFFGSPTFGVSTGCAPFRLSDGSRLNLATSIFADRNKIRYGKSILPDVPCPDSLALQHALKWAQTTY